MPLLGEMSVRLALDPSGVKTGASTAKQELSGVGESVNSVGTGFKGALGSIASFAAGGLLVAGVSTAVSKLTSFIGDSVQEAKDAADGQAQLAAVIKSTGGAAGVTADHVNALADKYAGLTKFEDDATRGAASMLLTFTNIGSSGGVFDRATITALNMSQALGQDLKNSSIQLGKALNDPIAGISALSRVGVTFTQTQKDQIAAFVNTNQLAKAQGVILDELDREFGNSAVAAGSTFAGQIEIANHKIKDIKETIGNALIPIMSAGVTAVLPLATSFADTLPAAIDTATLFFKTHILPIAQAFGTWIKDEGIPAVEKIGDAVFNKLVPALGNLWTAISPDLLPALKKLGDFLTGTVAPGISTTIEITGKIIDKFASFKNAGNDVAVMLSGVLIVQVARLGVEMVVTATKTAVSGIISLARFADQAARTAAILLFNVIPAVVGLGVEMVVTAGKTIAAGAASLVQFGEKAVLAAGYVWSTLIPSIIAAGADFLIMAGEGLAAAIVGMGAYAVAAWSAAVATIAATWPILLIVAGLLLLAGIIVEVVLHWDQLTQGLSIGADIVKNKVGDAFDWIGTKISQIIDTAKDVVSNGLNAIGNFFKNLHFEWPKIPLPHFKATGSFNLDPRNFSVPSIGVDWYAKGGIFNSPAVIGVGDAPGGEAVVPINKLPELLAQAQGESGGGKGVINVTIMLDSYMLGQVMGQAITDEVRIQLGGYR